MLKLKLEKIVYNCFLQNKKGVVAFFTAKDVPGNNNFIDVSFKGLTWIENELVHNNNNNNKNLNAYLY